ncbi:MAG: hypothetical protein NTW96_25750 [Planctomycetia bacterium]|nr:hypothetical protein [Planctomycetia bacterium]
MAFPSVAITRTELSATFSEFNAAMDRRGFIGPRVLVPRVVGVQKADVGKVPIEALLQTRETLRAPKTAYSRGDFEFGKFEFATEDHGVEEVLDDRNVKIYADILDAELIHTQRAEDAVARKYEIDVAAAVYDTSVWTGAGLTTALTNEWDDPDAATPIEDIEAARLKIINPSGLVPNALIVNRKQFFHLRRTDQIIDLIKYSGKDDPKRITASMLAQAFDLDFVLVAGGIKNTANEAATASISEIWGDEYAMLARVATSQDPQEPCLGRTFIWSGDGPGAPGSGEELAILVEEYREEKVRGSVIRARNDRDIVIMYKEAAHLLSNVITI